MPQTKLIVVPSGYRSRLGQRWLRWSLILGCLFAFILRPFNVQYATSDTRGAIICDTICVYSLLKSQGMGLAENSLRKLASSIVGESQKHSLDPMLILAIIEVESRFDHEAVSRRGAEGLMQIRPTAVAALFQKGEIPNSRMERKLKDPIVNVKIGTAYLSHLKEMFNDVRLALTAYHSGPTRVKLKLAAKDRIRFAYAGRVLSAKRSFEKNWKELMAVPGQHETGGRQIS